MQEEIEIFRPIQCCTKRKIIIHHNLPEQPYRLAMCGGWSSTTPPLTHQLYIYICIYIIYDFLSYIYIYSEEKVKQFICCKPENCRRVRCRLIMLKIILDEEEKVSWRENELCRIDTPTEHTLFIDAKLVLLSSSVLAAVNWIVGSERGKLSENFLEYTVYIV